MPDKRDKGGILGFGLLGSREKMERCRKSDGNAPLHIDVDVNMEAYGGRDFDRENWVFDNFKKLRPSLEKAVEKTVKEHGYPGPVIVHVRKTGER